jgi:ATP-dependent helicase HrpA
LPSHTLESEASPSFRQLRQRLGHCMFADRVKLRRKLQQCEKLNAERQELALLALNEAIESSVRVCELRLQQLPSIDYPDLPVSQHKEEIAKAIANNQVVIVAGETGSGKTTQIPKICLELGRGVAGLIGHTQPRRLAARTVANRIAEELKTPLGEKVGFKIRFSDQVSNSTYIKLMTDGILLAEIQQDRFLNQYDTIIIDEAHERSLNIDFILGYLKQLLPKRPELKLIITSATIDPERFSRHFDDAPIIQVSGRTFPVETRYRAFDDDPEQDRDQTQAIIDAVEELGRESYGDILVFLSGERDIRDTADALNKQQWRETEIVPLYARLSSAEQNRIFQGHTGRRIVLATNVAETSLTVPGIKYVIDPGTARISRYSYRSKVQRLPIEAISQASANQRAGRCGRVSNGICIRLYSEDDYLTRPEFTDPEITRTNLASVILQMLALGLGKIDEFPFVQAPDSRNINDGFRLLEELRAIDGSKGKFHLTPLGKQIARLPIDPRYARMVVEAAKLNCLKEIIVITAGLSIQDPRERPQDKRQAADEKHSEYASKESDFLAFWNLWQVFRQQQKALTAAQLRKWCKTQFINYLRMREWQDIVSQLKKSIAELGFGLNSQEADFNAIHQAIASGLLSHLGFKDKDREYLGARNSRFMIFPGSGLVKANPKWTMVAELVETSRLFGRIAAKIEPEWIEPLAGHLINKSYSEPVWSKKRGAVLAFEKVTLFGLTLVAQRKVGFSNIDPVVSREIFILEALVNGDTKLEYGFLRHNQLAVEEVEALEDRSRRRDLLVDEQHLIDFYQQRLPDDVCSESSFKRWWQKKDKAEQSSLLHFDPAQLLKQDTDNVNEYTYPKVWKQGNLRLALDYHFDPVAEDDGVSLLIPLPLLNQLHYVGFDWLIPGLRHELIINLIKSLPKKLRRNFVPAPNYADACMADLSELDNLGEPVAFLAALSLKLKRMTGIEVAPEEWQLASLPRHLQFNFKIVDGQGKLIKQSRDLYSLQHGLQDKISQTLQKVATPELEKSGLEQWDFGALPQVFVSKNSGFDMKAYPALVAEKKSVAIKLFDQPHLAALSHRAGLRQLIKINIPSPLSYLQQKLPNKAKLGLYFNPFGQINALIDDCVDSAINFLIDHNQQDDIRDEASFARLLARVKGELNELVVDIAKKVEQGLTTAHSINKRMKGNVPLAMINAHRDIKQHLEHLVYPGFVCQVGVTRLDDWNRYIAAIAKRLDKVAIDPTKDRMHQLNVEKIEQQYQSALAKVPKGQVIPEYLLQVRWMIEELRVSFFAQQLGTPSPISVKRIQNYLESEGKSDKS